jgi:hypothetical protein
MIKRGYQVNNNDFFQIKSLNYIDDPSQKRPPKYIS